MLERNNTIYNSGTDKRQEVLELGISPKVWNGMAAKQWFCSGGKKRGQENARKRLKGGKSDNLSLQT
jgi:hypothetical protein